MHTETHNPKASGKSALFLHGRTSPTKSSANTHSFLEYTHREKLSPHPPAVHLRHRHIRYVPGRVIAIKAGLIVFFTSVRNLRNIKVVGYQCVFQKAAYQNSCTLVATFAFIVQLILVMFGIDYSFIGLLR